VLSTADLDLWHFVGIERHATACADHDACALAVEPVDPQFHGLARWPSA